MTLLIFDVDCPPDLLQFRDRCLLVLYDLDIIDREQACENRTLQPLVEPDLHLYSFLRGLLAEFIAFEFKDPL